MKKILFVLIFLTSFACLDGIHNANATLMLTTDNRAVFDSTSGLFWWRDLSTFNGFNGVVNGINMTYAAQKTLISTLPGGTWHMALASEMQSLKIDNSAADINNFFIPIGVSVDIDFSQNPPVFTSFNIFVGRYDIAVGNVQPPTEHYVGTMVWDITNNVEYFPTDGTSIFLNSAASDDGYGGIGAWAVTNGYTPISPAPVPQTMLLLISGLVGVIGFNRSKRS